jgi:hypothetical protein
MTQPRAAWPCKRGHLAWRPSVARLTASCAPRYQAGLARPALAWSLAGHNGATGRLASGHCAPAALLPPHCYNAVVVAPLPHDVAAPCLVLWRSCYHCCSPCHAHGLVPAAWCVASPLMALRPHMPRSPNHPHTRSFSLALLGERLHVC